MIRLAANGFFQRKIPGRVKTLPYTSTIGTARQIGIYAGESADFRISRATV